MGLLYNLARMTTATTGTGTITLGSAISGFLSFAAAGVSDADVVSYAISDGANSEIGTGTYTASGTTLSRTVTKSTNSDAAISLSGNAQVFITPSAEDFAALAALVGATFTGKINLPEVSTSEAPINIAIPGASTVPTVPVNGDLWPNSLGLFFHEGGISKQFVFNGSQAQFFQPGIKNPAQTFDYVIKGSAITAERDVTLPLLTADDEFLMKGFSTVLNAGFGLTTHDAGTFSTGTFTVDEADGNSQKAINNGTHTLAPPTNDCGVVVKYTNGASAGAITTSGFTDVDVSEYVTTNALKFFFYITVNDSDSQLIVRALQ